MIERAQAVVAVLQLKSCIDRYNGRSYWYRGMVQDWTTLSVGWLRRPVAAGRSVGAVGALAIRQCAWNRSECARTMAGRQRARRTPGQPTLVLLAHPQCSCTRASLDELGEALARTRIRPTTYVLS